MSFKTDRTRIISTPKKETFRCLKAYHEEMMLKEKKAAKKEKKEKKKEKVLPGVF